MRTISIFLVVLALAACSRSLPYIYKASLSRPESKALGPLIALADFRDLREAPYKNTPPSFFLIYRKRAFGLTHLKQKFTSPSRVLRDIIYWELSHAGANIVLLDATPEDNPAQPTLISLAKQKGAEYLLFGEFQDLSVVVTPPSRGLAMVLVYIPVIGLLANALLNTWKADYQMEIQFSLVRLNEGEGEVVWTNRFSDGFVEKGKKKGVMVDTFFETLSPVVNKGAGTALDQIDMRLQEEAQETQPAPSE